MIFLQYQASKDDEPETSIKRLTCPHGKVLGVHVRHGMRCYSWLFRLCK